MSQWIVGVLILAALVYVGIPLLIFFTQKMKGRPEMRTLTEADLPPQLTNYLYSTAASLREDGFSGEAYLSLPNPVHNVRAYLIMMANRETGDKAMVTIVTAGRNSIDQLTAYVEFSTRFASGRVYDTINSPAIGSFDPGPNTTVTQLWEVPDPHQLYRIHRHILTRMSPPEPGDVPVLYEKDEAVPYLRQVLMESYQKEVNRGILRAVGSGDSIEFMPTLYGAFKISYRQLPPFARMVRDRILKQAHAVLQSFLEAESPECA